MNRELIQIPKLLPAYEKLICRLKTYLIIDMFNWREDKHNNLSCVYFTRLCNIISWFTELYMSIFTNGIDFPLSSSAGGFKWRKKVLTGLEKHVKTIDTSRYGDIIITDHCFCKHSPIQRSSAMIVIRVSLFQCQHTQITKLFITFCKYSTEIYHFNLLISITIIYHIYIECELYNLANIN